MKKANSTADSRCKSSALLKPKVQGKSLFSICCFSIPLFFSTNVFSQPITFISPADSEIIAKKPLIKCDISVPFDKTSLYISLDYTDMTALAEVTDGGFSVRPFHVIDPGSHTVTVNFTDAEGEFHETELTFSTRHSKAFETFSSTNSLSAVYTQLLVDEGNTDTSQLSGWNVESNFSTNNLIKEGNLEINMLANAKYSNQEYDYPFPVEDGFHLVDFLVQSTYTGENVVVSGGAGDVSIETTPYTLGSLSRRGVTLSLDSEHFFANTFGLQSQQVYGNESSDKLYGIYSGFRFFDRKFSIGATYVHGEEDTSTSSFAAWPAQGNTEGDLIGVEAKLHLFDDKLIAKAEANFSDYDQDTSDTDGSVSDQAYMGQLTGTIDFFSYDLLYEHLGADYKVVTSSVQQDREGFAARSGLSTENHQLDLSFSLYEDNVDEDPAFSQIETMQYSATYSLSLSQSWPFSLGWNHSEQESSAEPAGSSEIETSTNTFYGSFGYNGESLSIGIQPEYTQVDDSTITDYDTNNSSLTVYSSLVKERFSISPSITLSRQEDVSENTDYDSLSGNFSFSFAILETLNLDGTATYTINESSDDTVEQDAFSGELQLSYSPQEPFFQVFTPTIQLLASHDLANDDILDSDSNQTLVYLILSGNLDLSF